MAGEIFLSESKMQLPLSWRFLPVLLIWGSQWDINTIKEPSSTYWSGSGRNPVGFMRTSWKDSNAVYVAMKGVLLPSRMPYGCGQFVMDAQGERWQWILATRIMNHWSQAY